MKNIPEDGTVHREEVISSSLIFFFFPFQGGFLEMEFNTVAPLCGFLKNCRPLTDQRQTLGQVETFFLLDYSLDLPLIVHHHSMGMTPPDLVMLCGERLVSSMMYKVWEVFSMGSKTS